MRDVQFRLHNDSIAQRSACRQAKNFRSIDPTKCPGVALEFRARRYERSMPISARPTQIYGVLSKFNARPERHSPKQAQPEAGTARSRHSPKQAQPEAGTARSRHSPKQAQPEAGTARSRHGLHMQGLRDILDVYLPLLHASECSPLHHGPPPGALSVVNRWWVVGVSRRSSTAPIDGGSLPVQAIWGRAGAATSLAPAVTATVATSIRMRRERALS